MQIEGQTLQVQERKTKAGMKESSADGGVFFKNREHSMCSEC